MVAATGHRICNDCMKSCIYQKQDPVDIPQSETRILKDVLELPWASRCMRCSPAGTRSICAARCLQRRPEDACWWWGWGPQASRSRTT